MVNTRCGANMTLREAAELIKKREEEREEERKLVSKFESEHRDEINEILGLIGFIDDKYLEKSYPEIYNFGPGRLGIHFKDKWALRDYVPNSSSNQYRQLDYLKKAIKVYQGQDEEVEKYVENVKAFTDKPLDELALEDVRAIRKKVKFPRRLEIPVFCELTGRLPHKELEFNERDLIIHFYNTFLAVSEKLLGKPVRYRVNVLYHLLRKIGKEPKASSFTFMKDSGHKRTEEEIKLVFEHLGWDYSPIVGTES